MVRPATAAFIPVTGALGERRFARVLVTGLLGCTATRRAPNHSGRQERKREREMQTNKNTKHEKKKTIKCTCTTLTVASGPLFSFFSGSSWTSYTVRSSSSDASDCTSSSTATECNCRPQHVGDPNVKSRKEVRWRRHNNIEHHSYLLHLMNRMFHLHNVQCMAFVDNFRVQD